MNYLKVYCNLIRKAENRTPPEGYTEKHHTFPKSIYGNNNRVVVLTTREHYIAHALLEKVCIQRYGLNNWKTYKMICAHKMMSYHNIHKRYFNSYLYEANKKNFINYFSKNNPSHSLDVKEKQIKSALMRWEKESERERMVGENNHFYGKKHTLETRKKISKNHHNVSGINNPNSKSWKLVFEDGKILIVDCLSIWCRENNYNRSNVCNVYKNRSKNHRGIVSVEKVC